MRSLQFPSREISRSQLNLDDNIIFFLNLASYDGRKNQIGLINAFDQVARRHSNIRLLCAGNILDPYYHERVTEHLETLVSKDQIQVKTYIEDVGTFLVAADAFILPSFFEGWSISGTEALLAGTPLILTECGSSIELVGKNNERGILIPNPGGDALTVDRDMMDMMIANIVQSNEKSLEDAITEIIKNVSKWRRRRGKIIEYAQDEFSIDKMIISYRRKFDDVLNSYYSK